ncbi:MAG: hypothetical protein AAFQ90_02940 [Pseudomonadota bacterium]
MYAGAEFGTIAPLAAPGEEDLLNQVHDVPILACALGDPVQAKVTAL